MLATPSGEEFILCQITSQNVKDTHAISLVSDDFESGNLNKTSNIRPNRIFTADKKILLYTAGHIKKMKLDATI